jgi:hypothetical protein
MAEEFTLQVSTVTMIICYNTLETEWSLITTFSKPDFRRNQPVGLLILISPKGLILSE